MILGMCRFTTLYSVLLETFRHKKTSRIHYNIKLAKTIMNNPNGKSESRNIILHNNGSRETRRLIRQLENVGWNVEDFRMDQMSPSARSDDGRKADGFSQIRRKFVGYK